MAEQLIHSLQFPGLPDTYVIPEVGRNLLDNACFVGGGSQQGGKQFPINSRGLTQYSTYENPVPQRYFIDRWVYPNTLSVSIQSDSIRITNNNSQLTGIYQRCSQTFPAKQMIFSCLINTHNAGSNIRFLLGRGPYLNNSLNISPSGEDEWQLITLLSDPEDSVDRVEIDFVSSSTGYIDIRAVKLEFGIEQTLAHKENDIWILNEIPDYEFELLKCKTATVDSSDIYANNLNIADKNYCRNNLLRNWYFVGGGTGTGIFPINQRSLNVYSSQALCIDGWWFFPYSGGTLTLTSSGAVIAKNSSTSSPGFHQFFDGIEDGSVVTISCMTTEGVQWVTSSPLSSQGGTSWQVSQHFYYSTVHVWCGLRFNQGHWNVSFTTEGATIVAVKVELGTQQTLAHFENETWLLNELPNYQEELFKCQTSIVDSNDIYANGMVSINVPNPNLLANWYFVGGGSQQGDRQFPINSRGLTTYTGNANFTIDRWWMRNTNNTGSPTVNVLSEGVQIVTDGASNQGLNQPIDGFRNLAGKTVTASLLITQNTFTSGSYPYFGLWNSTTVTTNNTNVKAISLAGQGTGLFTFTVTLPQNWTNNYLNIGIYFSTYVGSIKVSAMKLELGTQQTLAHLENGEWVLNEIPNYSEELYKCLTADDDTDSYADWKTVVGKLNSYNNPYLRFFGDGNTAHQYTVLSSGDLVVQSYDGTSWSTIARYNPSDRFVTMLSDYVTLSSQTWTTWSGGNVYGIPISFTSMPSGYHIISATLYQFASWPSGGSFEAFANGTSLYALSTIAKANIGNCKLQYRVVLEKD